MAGANRRFLREEEVVGGVGVAKGGGWWWWWWWVEEEEGKVVEGRRVEGGWEHVAMRNPMQIREHRGEGLRPLAHDMAAAQPQSPR